jgi:GntR family transcriptional regulator/MocR family aminotransferase
MHIPLDHQDKTQPLYQQIAAFLRQRILSGSLAPGNRLPAARRLAADLGVNRITVESAYDELQADGLVTARQGSGTYVLAPPPLPPLPQADPGAPWPLWQQEVQGRAAPLKRPAPDELLRAAAHPQPLNFAGGVGDASLFPVDDLRRAIQTVLRRDGVAALEYGERRGYGPLRGTIAQVLASQGLALSRENILVTAGSQQALALVVQTLLKPGEAIVVENPTYAGALDLFRLYGLRIVGLPVDEDGMQVEKLEKLLQQHHPRLIYTIPNFHNPTGACLSLPRRRQLVALADRYNVPILEDDYVGDLRYDGRPLPALKALDSGGRVIYASTFSKVLLPGLRVGFLAAEGPVYDCLVESKRVHDLTTSNLYQRALEAYVTVGRYQAHLNRSCLAYRKRRDAMQAALAGRLPGRVSYLLPQGGLFLWLRIDGVAEAFSTDGLLPLACQHGVAFAPGSSFYPQGCDGSRYLRLNFTLYPPETIFEGIRRLGEAIRAGA